MAALQTIQKIGPVLDLFTVSGPSGACRRSLRRSTFPGPRTRSSPSCRHRTPAVPLTRALSDRLADHRAEPDLQGTVDVKSCASPVLQALSDEYGETTHLAILERYRVFYVDKVVGNHIINITGARVGPISMLTAAPSAKYSSRTATATRSNAM